MKGTLEEPLKLCTGPASWKGRRGNKMVGHVSIVKCRILSCQAQNLFYQVKVGSDLLKDIRMLTESWEELKKQALEWASRNNPQNLCAEVAEKGFSAPDNSRTTPPLLQSVPEKWMPCIHLLPHRNHFCIYISVCASDRQSLNHTTAPWRQRKPRNVGVFAFCLGKMGFTPWGTILM